MKILFLFATAFVVALSGALMPGPLFTLTLAHAPRSGWRFGPLAVAGHGILEFSLIAGLYFGAGSLLAAPAFQACLGLAGGAILLWMGVDMARAAWTGRKTALPPATGGTGKAKAVLIGIVASLSNPYWSFWWATVGLAYLTVAAELGTLGVAVFFLGHISGDLLWYTAVSLAAAKGADLAGSRLYPAILALCGAVLVLLGGWFFIRGTHLLRGL